MQLPPAVQRGERKKPGIEGRDGVFGGDALGIIWCLGARLGRCGVAALRAKRVGVYMSGEMHRGKCVFDFFVLTSGQY